MRNGLVSLLLCAVAADCMAQGGISLPEEVYKTPGPHVVVNGALLKAPVKEVGGSLLLPMRAVFEALQAEVRWFPSAQQIVAKRGDTTVQLWIQRPVAIVNDKEIRLATAPILMDGATYVPLRFPAEAFGGEVKWLGSVRTAAITITPLTGVASGTTDQGSQPPIKTETAPTTLDGVILTKVTSGVTAMLLQHGKGETTLVQLAPNAILTRANGGEPARSATFAELEPGDLVKVTRDTAGKAVAVAARFAEVKGVAAAIANNRLLLRDGSLYQLQADVRVANADGTAVPLAQISDGTEVTLRLTPDTTNVWRIVVPTVTQPATGASTDRPGILTVAAVGYSKAVRAGGVLTLQVTGEPGAERVTADIGEVVRGVVLEETTPGTYTRRVTVPANTNATDVPIVASMRLNGKDMPPVKSANSVTLDTRPPSFNALLPGEDARLLDRSPTIEAAYADPGGSGVDPKSVTITVGGVDVTKRAVITDARLSYKAVSLPIGPAQIHIEVADAAGNKAAADWTVTVVEVRSTTEQYVRHDAATPLMAGAKLSLAAKLAMEPAKIEWYLGNHRVSAAKSLDAASGEYRAVYTVGSDTELGEHSVSVRITGGDGRNEVLYATRPVQIAAQPKRFRVLAPSDKAKAPSPFVVSGEATPGARVRVAVAYSGRIAFLPVKGELYKDVLTADAKGVWTTEALDVSSVLVKPDSYTVTVELLGPDEAATDTVKLSLTRP